MGNRGTRGSHRSRSRAGVRTSAARISVETFDEIRAHDLGPRELGGVVRSLNAGAASVLVVEDWLVGDTAIESIDGERRIFAGRVERETEKAWLFATGQVENWIPKSQCLLFETETDDEIETPQQTLPAFERKKAEP
jgi:hypothetical protein